MFSTVAVAVKLTHSIFALAKTKAKTINNCRLIPDFVETKLPISTILSRVVLMENLALIMASIGEGK